MKAIALAGMCSALFAASMLMAQEIPPAAKPQQEHEWLQKFVGEWETDLEASMGPDQPPMKCKGAIKSRTLGGLWVVSEFESEMMGMSMIGVQTIGYDTKSKKYVGTWVDNMMNHMWKYQGTIEEGGKKLTLEAEGPNFMQEGKTAKFRDAYEFTSSDKIVMTSSMQGDDGKWITFMTGTANRKKAAPKTRSN